MVESHGWIQNRVYTAKIIIHNDFNTTFFLDSLELITEGAKCQHFPTSFYLQEAAEGVSRETIVTTTIKPLEEGSVFIKGAKFKFYGIESLQYVNSFGLGMDHSSDLAFKSQAYKLDHWTEEILIRPEIADL